MEFIRSFFTVYPVDINYKMTTLEKTIPFIIMILCLIVIIVFREKIRGTSKIDNFIRIITAILLATAIPWCIMEWYSKGFKVGLLPLYFCNFSFSISTLLVLTKKRYFYDVALYSGIVAAVSIFYTKVTFSHEYFRYYEYMFTHMAALIIPMYFTIVYRYTPKIKNTILAYILVLCYEKFIVIFNIKFNTFYFIEAFSIGIINEICGSGLTYLIGLDIFIAIIILILFLVFSFILKNNNTNEEVIQLTTK